MPIAPLPPFPSHWVDELFSRLTLIYGQEFLRRFEGIPLDSVKADWAARLARFSVQPKAIAYALSMLPADKAPTVLAFVDLCRRAPLEAAPALAAPNPDPESVKRAADALKALKFRPQGDTSWAHSLREREQRSPAGLTQFQRDAWRYALAPQAPEGAQA